MFTASALVHRISASVDRSQRLRRDRRALRRDLLAFNTRADVDDLLAALDRHQGPDADEMRSVLSERLLTREASRAGVPVTW
ncbi:MAG: hypothetical protein QOK15_807 [Nocardioidaceae bacterium]|jgi:hypothetical protein|nr:hypothetical protein [Nocardioidaceae bacterium]